MSKFKVGDKVQHKQEKGFTYTIQSVRDSIMHLKDAAGSYRIEDFELVKDDKMSTFKVGDRVKCIDGARSSLIPGHIYIVKDSDNKMVVIEGTHYAFSNTRFELVKEETPLPPTLDEMPLDEQALLFIAWRKGKTIQKLHAGEWSVEYCPKWSFEGIYRVKPDEVIPDSFDWSHAKFNYVARDEDGKVYGYDEAPKRGMRYWSSLDGTFHLADSFTSYKKGNLPWDQSLICRPGFEVK